MVARVSARIIAWLLLIITACPFINGQVSPLYSKHYNYEQFINPAISGRDNIPVLNLSHKQYWLSTKESPSTTCLGASMRLGSFDFYNPKKLLNKTGFLSKGRMGIGGMVMQDKDGPLRSYFAALTYAYYLPLKQYDGELSFGLSAQMNSLDVNRNILTPYSDNDQEIFKMDDYNKSFFDAGCGIYYHDAQFYAGASINNLFLSKTPMSAFEQRDYFFQTGYKFFFERFELEPSLFIAKIDDQAVYSYNQVKCYYLNYNWISAGYKSTKSLILSFGLNIKRMYIAYALEQNVSSMSSYFSTAHEIMLGVNIGLFKPQGIRKKAGKR